MFRVLNDGLPDDVQVIHSAGVARHKHKRWAEIDFVVVSGAGIFCLEVKGGRITREGSEWFTNGEKLGESPFQQAGSAAAALRKDVRGAIPATRKVPIGYGVVFPDVPFNEEGTDIEQEIVFDAADLSAPVTDYLAHLENYWTDRLRGTDFKGEPRPLSHSDRDSVIDRLAGDFDLMRTIKGDVDAVERDLVRLTDEQIALMDVLVENERVLVKGSAGTGKTLIAVAEARRMAEEGRRVLLTCFNRRLAAYLEEELEAESEIDVCNIDRFTHSVVSEAGRLEEIPDADPGARFRVWLPSFAAEILLEEDNPRYDAIVVDEFQDLLLTDYVDVLEASVAGGISGGTWRVFLDPNQALFDSTDPVELKKVESHASSVRLQQNCRNTKPIADHVAMVVGLLPQETLHVDGTPVLNTTFPDSDGPSGLVAETLEGWLSQGFLQDQILVLSPHRLEKSAVKSRLPGGLVLVDDPDDLKGSNQILYSTIQAFKGLDRTAVLLVDFTDFLDADQRPALYVGGSRARALLAMCSPESAMESYAQRAKEFGEQLG